MLKCPLRQQGQHILHLHILLLQYKRNEVEANKPVPTLNSPAQSLPIQLPKVSLTVLDLDDIILKKTHFEVLLVDLNSETIPDMLDCQILAYGFELRDEYVIGHCSFFVFFEEVGKCLFKDVFRPDSIRIRPSRYS